MFKKKQTPAGIGAPVIQPGVQVVNELVGNVESNTGIVEETLEETINRIENFTQTMHDEVTTVLNTMADRIVALEENRNPELHEQNNNQRLSVLEQNVLGGQNLIQSVVSETNALIEDYMDLKQKVLLQKKYRNQEPTTLEDKVQEAQET